MSLTPLYRQIPPQETKSQIVKSRKREKEDAPRVLLPLETFLVFVIAFRLRITLREIRIPRSARRRAKLLRWPSGCLLATSGASLLSKGHVQRSMHFHDVLYISALPEATHEWAFHDKAGPRSISISACKRQVGIKRSVKIFCLQENVKRELGPRYREWEGRSMNILSIHTYIPL
jgi:hypothetical protein